MGSRFSVQNVRSPGAWRKTPRSEKSSKRRFRFTFKKRWVRSLLLLAGALIVLGVFSTVIVFAWVARDLPNPNKINDRVVAQSTKIYDREGTTLLYEIHGEEKRTSIELGQVSDNLKHATLVAEDKDFYKHHGFDLRGIIRALFVNLIHLNPSAQGGSTITQQFIKNSVLTSEKSYIRKIKELILAYQLEQRFTKDEILKLYLNEIPYGSNAYGVEAAAQTFFNVNAKDLDLAQSALLASLPRGTTYYSPFGNHTDALFARQHAILDGMAKEHYVTQEEVDGAKAETLTFNAHREKIIAPHFVFYVRDLLAEQYGDAALEQAGLKVITTLDVKHQQAAEDAIAAYADKNEKSWKATNAAMTSLDTKTGQILSMVGSRDYFDTANDGNVNVVLRPRQPGSSFKPIVYTTAFEKGYTPETMLFDLVTNFDTGSGTPYTPHNYDSAEHGPLSMRKALAGSLNIPAVQTLYLAGVNHVLDVAEQLGYTTLGDRSRFGLSLVLGGAEVRLLDHVSAFATLAREGVRHPVTAILRIEDKSGKMVQEFKNQETRVIDEKAVRQTNSILSDDGARAYIFGAGGPLTLPGRPVAAKTGTTNDYRDAWTLGYTPSIAAGVWVGNNDNSEMKRGADGSIVAAPIWHKYMQTVLADTPVETFKTPDKNDAEKPILHGEIDTMVSLPVDSITKKVIPESCRATYPAAFTTTQQFKQTHAILFWVNKDDPRGAVPEDPNVDPQYHLWEAAVQTWARAHGYPDIPNLPQERCDLRAGATTPVVSISSPSAGATLTAATNTFTADVGSSATITKVTFSIDGTDIGSATTSPYAVTYTNTLFRNGSHTLHVTATDDAGATGSSDLSFTYSLSHDAARVLFLSPQPSAVFRTSDFPINIETSVFDPRGFVTVKLLRGSEVLAVKDQPANGTVFFSLSSLPTGSQTLTLLGANADSETVTATLTLTIQ